jgi:hypothetical protein
MREKKKLTTYFEVWFSDILFNEILYLISVQNSSNAVKIHKFVFLFCLYLGIKLEVHIGS